MAKSQESVSGQPMEADIISDYLQNGSDTYSEKDIERLVQATVIAPLTLFNKIVDKASQDEKIRSEIYSRLSKSVSQALESNVELAKQSIAVDKEAFDLTKQAIDKLIEDGQISSDECRRCFIDLRFYSDRINETVRRSQDFNMDIITRYQDEEEEVVRKSGSSTEEIVTGAIAGVACTGVGIGIGWWLHKIYVESKDDD